MKRLVSMLAMITVAFALSMPVFAAQNSTGETTTTTHHHKHHKNKKSKKSHKNKKNKNEAPAQ